MKVYELVIELVKLFNWYAQICSMYMMSLKKNKEINKKKTFLGFFEIILLNTEKFKYYVTELL